MALIDKENLKANILKMLGISGEKYLLPDERALWNVINAEPTQEIIRCKDCKFYGRADKRRFYRGSDCLNKRIDTIVPDRDFCSRAERRVTDGGTS